MSCLRNAAFAAIAAACLSSVAAPAFAQERVAVQSQVPVADLDLSTPAGLARAEQRVRRYAETACGTDSRDLRLIADARRCRDEMMADGHEKVVALAGRRDVQVAAIGNVKAPR